MKYLVQFLLLIAWLHSFSQAPVINSFSPLSAGPNQKIVITGSGFSSTLSENEVWFDQVKGTVTAATIYSLQVQVPPQARLSNIEVINKKSAVNLTAKSSLKFIPSYGGTQLPNTPPFTSSYTNGTDSFNELYDIAGADFDLDGKPDLVTSRGASTGNATDIYVYKNTSTGIGTLTYTRYDKSNLPALNLNYPTTSVASGDLNGDGKPDIVATRGGSVNNNQVFILKNSNTVAGTMAFNAAPSLFLDALQVAFAIAIRDLNGDGKPEIIVSNSYQITDPSVGSQIYVFPNQSTLSSITFGAAIKLNVVGATSTYGLDVQDLDGDSKADIVVTQYQQSDIFIFRNTSTGNFSFDPVVKITAPGKLNLITTSDLNNDGLLDLIASAALDNNVQIWINKSTQGNFLFNTSQILNTSIGPWGVNASDIDGDGDTDLIIANKNGAGPQYNAADTKINIFRQDASLTFTKLDIVTATPSRSVRVGDFDADGKPDIAFSIFSLGGSLNTLSVLRNTNCWAPIITGPSNTICTGQTDTLKILPALGATYTWSPQTSSTNILPATIAGTFTVTVTGTVDAACVNASPGYTLTQDNNTFPSPPAIGNTPLQPCLGAALNLSTSSVADSYSWTGPNNFTSTLQNPIINSVTNVSAGVYTLQLKMNNGCTSNIVSKTLDVASVPVLPVTASPSPTGCVGGSMTLSVPNSGSYTYQWNKAGTPIGGQTTASLSLPSLSASDEANYTVSVKSTANSCTQDTAPLSVQVFSIPVANFSFSGNQCSGATITFADQSTKDSRGTLTYTWTFGDGTPVSNAQNPTHAYATASTFVPSLTVSYSGSCPNTNSPPKSIVINNAVTPTIVASANPICNGDQTTLSISGTFTSINWVGVTGTTSSVVISSPGAYSVNTTDANNCLGTGSLTILLKPTFSPFAAKSKRNSTKLVTINLGDTTQLVATAGADSYLWSPGKTLSDSISANPIAKPQTSTKYIVVATKSGMCNATDTVTVNVETAGAVIKPPVLFIPASQITQNQKWLLSDAEVAAYADWTMTIYDGHGSQVYQQKGYNNVNAWDGSFEGKPAHSGTYFYVFSNSKDKPATGSVLLVR